MPLRTTTTPPVTDAGLARWLAARAGQLLLDLRAELGHADPDALRTAGDRRAHELLTAELARWRPADAVLSEEGVDDPARLAAERVWIVDPLDGTREYGEEGRTDWAVHVALWRRTVAAAADGRAPAGRLVAGAVALPAQHRLLGTDEPPAYPPMNGGTALTLAASRSRPPAFLAGLAAAVGAELVPMGSAGAKIAAVVCGQVDAYVHAGGQYEWDSAAPVAVATATGLHASRIDGSGLEYNRADPRLPDLVVCRKDLAARLLTALAKLA
jgi:3'(2'), 5'-bisphosphate nucleotidase